jgi:ElaB/YqjD/DUF883 family membrane-anchored ribosome-binding protein
MPSIIVQDADGDARVLRSKPFAYEEILQKNIAQVPDLISLETVSDEPISFLTIGQEWPAGTGRADIVLVGSDAILTIVETKLSRNPEARREVIAQLLEYAAYLSEWTIYEIQSRAEEYFLSEKAPSDCLGKSFDDVLAAFLEDSDESIESFKGEIEENLRRGRLRLIVGVDEVGEQAQKIVTFVNAYSSFDIYLLQIAFYTDEGDRHIFVPTLHGYARKVSTTRGGRQWDWDDYEPELGWASEQVSAARQWIDRLLSVAQEWQPETRLHQGWVSVRCLGREMLGVQVFKRRGLEIWFKLADYKAISIPESVTPRKTKEYLYLSGALHELSDDTLRGLTRLGLEQAGLLSSAP